MVQSVEVGLMVQSREEWRTDMEERTACPCYRTESDSACPATGRGVRPGLCRGLSRAASLLGGTNPGAASLCGGADGGRGVRLNRHVPDVK